MVDDIEMTDAAVASDADLGFGLKGLKVIRTPSNKLGSEVVQLLVGKPGAQFYVVFEVETGSKLKFESYVRPALLELQKKVLRHALSDLAA